jgi:hypothetical protein
MRKKLKELKNGLKNFMKMIDEAVIHPQILMLKAIFQSSQNLKKSCFFLVMSILNWGMLIGFYFDSFLLYF